MPLQSLLDLNPRGIDWRVSSAPLLHELFRAEREDKEVGPNGYVDERVRMHTRARAHTHAHTCTQAQMHGCTYAHTHT